MNSCFITIIIVSYWVGVAFNFGDPLPLKKVEKGITSREITEATTVAPNLLTTLFQLQLPHPPPNSQILNLLGPAFSPPLKPRKHDQNH